MTEERPRRLRLLELSRRGRGVAVLSRGLAVVLALAWLAASPGIGNRRGYAVSLVAAYALLQALLYLRWPHSPAGPVARLVYDVSDAFWAFALAAVTGGIRSPLWLVVYPHVVAVSVRGGRVYSVAIALFEGALLYCLRFFGPWDPLVVFHAMALVWCAAMGGSAAAHVFEMRAALSRANRELEDANARLREALVSNETIREELKAHAERLAAIDEIANAVNQSLSIDDTFRRAAQEARRLVRFDRLTAALLDDAGLHVEIVGGGPSRGGRVRLSRSDAEWAMKRPTVWSAGESEPSAERVHRVLDNAAVLAAATIPLHSRGRLVGALNLGRERQEPFTSWELEVMEPVARHIAIALDNARLFEEVKNRGSELESLLEIGRGISGRLALPDLLPMVTRSVNRLMGTEFCMLLLREGDELRLGAQEGLEPEVVAVVGKLRVGESLSGWAVAEGRPLSVYEMKDDPRLRFHDVVDRYGYRSFFCVPLKRGDDTIGTLEVVTKTPRRFTSADQDLMTLLADQAAVAIENARLFEEAHKSLAAAKEANRQLEDLDHHRQQYLRNVSHEFRTPLTVIKGYSEHLTQAALPDERSFREIVRILGESSDRLIELVDTLLEVSRVEQSLDRGSLRLQPLDLRDLVTGSIDDLRAAAERKQVALSLHLPAEPLKFEGDLGLLQQVVRKLVDNAVKYSTAGGRVEVRARPGEDDVALEVEDMGIGIAAEHLPRIFDKFYTVDGGLDRRAGGAGVGLYLVREIVRLHRGTVDVQSRPGKGSLFSVRLPRDGKVSSSAAIA